MDATSPFQQLPGEIRQQIYLAYFSTPDNIYVFDFPSKKLRKSDNSPIDISLVATCRAIAKETRGMAFRLNTIKFNTTYSDELRILAGRFHMFISERRSALKSDFSNRAASMDPAKLGNVINRHPVLVPTIEEIKTYGRSPHSGYWADVPSRVYFASLDALRAHLASLPPDGLSLQASNDPQCHNGLMVVNNPPRRYDRERSEKLVGFEINPWDIPLEYELDDNMLEDAAWVELPTHLDKRYHAYERCRYIDNGKYRFSATATAIYFLRRIMPETRCLVQNIMIDEDYRSVAFPECHALGLIPFCQENPSLRIIRGASLWGNIFLSRMDEPHWQRHIRLTFHCLDPDPPAADELPLGDIVQVVAAWMSEAGILTSMGMPVGQFTFFMDGDPFPEEASEIFRTELQEAALLQETVCKAPRPGRWCAYVQRIMDHFLFDDFPRLLADLSNNRESGIIQCNFDPGTSVGSPDEILSTHPEWSWQEWEYELWDHFEGRDDTLLPGFDQMVLHNNMTETYCQKFPNGPPRGSVGDYPDWDDNQTQPMPDLPVQAGDPEEADDTEESDAHEADV
ncbi:unnamed protein product [Clonostachys byssicola]|uniref:Uncharacterized protein n=1 Tax=Clonostachys byssicola TaxID=160290 RepID=A0A9N9UTM4_9HYPO|nr:unnamed protein product [Clonostachys byssicola]